ncbi:MAG TPA: sigma-70 family RNA polymerase sigma factor [Sandaracinaceae bacterium LLY-WYZ-13_1]|nr:sigma-70 family RNA polymerase sigma factor [Sandaracinaceae bacterium LLY-WYZ-13_1]
MTERASQSSRAARSLGRVFAEEGAFVLRTIRRMGASPMDAEDLTQQVFVVLHRRPDLLAGDAPVRSVLFGVLRRVLADHRKRERRAPARARVEASVEPEQERRLQRSEARRRLDEALAQLDDRRREVLVLYELEEMSMPEVARVLEIPVQTAYTRLHAARTSVRKLLRRSRVRAGATRERGRAS